MSRDRTAAAHFQLFADNAWSQVSWRLLSSNNRVLGRSPAACADLESALLAIKELTVLIEDSLAELRPTPEHRWRWTLRTGGTVIARSGHDYDRKVRCSSAVVGFVRVVPLATVIESVTFTSPRRIAAAPVVPIGGKYPAARIAGAR